MARGTAEEVVAEFGVRTAGVEHAARSLSGGNLQKFVVGREILHTPSVLVVAQPTWGVDAGACETIHRALLELAAGGCAVVVISQDLDELFDARDPHRSDRARPPVAAAAVRGRSSESAAMRPRQGEAPSPTARGAGPPCLGSSPAGSLARDGLRDAVSRRRADDGRRLRCCSRRSARTRCRRWRDLHQAADPPRGIAELPVKATPLVLIATGLAIGFRAGVWNIGAEGQFTIGALAGGSVALAVYPGGGFWLLPLMMLAGMLGGMAWAAIPAFLRTRFNANEILVSLMLSYVAVLLLSCSCMACCAIRKAQLSAAGCSAVTRCCRCCIPGDPRPHRRPLVALRRRRRGMALSRHIAGFGFKVR